MAEQEAKQKDKDTRNDNDSRYHLAKVSKPLNKGSFDAFFELHGKEREWKKGVGYELKLHRSVVMGL